MVTHDVGENNHSDTFICVFCEGVLTYRIGQLWKYEKHLKILHNISEEISNMCAINFLSTREKQVFINQAKQYAKKGDLFNCGLCSDKSWFSVGKFKIFKDHLETSHKISYEFGTLLAMTLNDFSTNRKLLINVKQKYDNNIEHVEVLQINPSKYSNQDSIQFKDTDKIKLHNLVPNTETKNINYLEHKIDLINDKKASEIRSTTDTKSEINSNESQIGIKTMGKTDFYGETVKCIYCSFVPKNQTQIGM